MDPRTSPVQPKSRYLDRERRRRLSPAGSAFRLVSVPFVLADRFYRPSESRYREGGTRGGRRLPAGNAAAGLRSPAARPGPPTSPPASLRPLCCPLSPCSRSTNSRSRPLPGPAAARRSFSPALPAQFPGCLAPSGWPGARRVLGSPASRPRGWGAAGWQLPRPRSPDLPCGSRGPSLLGGL